MRPLGTREGRISSWTEGAGEIARWLREEGVVSLGTQTMTSGQEYAQHMLIQFHGIFPPLPLQQRLIWVASFKRQRCLTKQLVAESTAARCKFLILRNNMEV